MFGLFGPRPDEQRLGALVRDLFTIQVNTLIKPEITSSAMPDVRIALCDIAERYQRYFVERGTDTRAAEPLPGSFATFTALEATAAREQDRLGAEVTALDEPEQVDYYRLSRIRRHSAQVCMCLRRCARRHGIDLDSGNTGDAAFRRAANAFTRAELTSADDIEDLDLERSEYATIRKIWEIGLERVAMQTVVELDGDVFTRVRPEFARDPEPGLQALHEASVRLGVGHWATVVDIIGRIATGFTRALSGMFNRR